MLDNAEFTFAILKCATFHLKLHFSGLWPTYFVSTVFCTPFYLNGHKGRTQEKSQYVIWTLYHYIISIKEERFTKCTRCAQPLIKQVRGSIPINKISHLKISLVFVWQTLGAEEGCMWSECWWFTVLCWLITSCDNRKCVILAVWDSLFTIFSCEKPPSHGQPPKKYKRFNTFLFTLNASVQSNISAQSLTQRHWGNIIFTETKEL